MYQPAGNRHSSRAPTAIMARAVLIDELEQQRLEGCHGNPTPAMAARPREGGLAADNRADHADFATLQ